MNTDPKTDAGIAISALLDAVSFAAEKHRNQKRKDAQGTPYINHPITVANLMVTVGGIIDIEALQAALLHDTVEDTATTPDEIEERFGYVVRSLVMEVTDDKDLPKLERKSLQIEHASHLPPQAGLIKLADKISNISDIINSPPPDWDIDRKREYLAWSRNVIGNIRNPNPALKTCFDERCLELSRALQE